MIREKFRRHSHACGGGLFRNGQFHFLAATGAGQQAIVFSKFGGVEFHALAALFAMAGDVLVQRRRRRRNGLRGAVWLRRFRGGA